MSNLITKKTAKLPDNRSVEMHQSSAIDIGVLRPWRVALIVKRLRMKIVADITESITLGRSTPDSSGAPLIDLRPFGAEELGVSRRHLLITLEGDSLFIEDLNSSNSTFLNGKRLQPHTRYRVRHGDELVVGLMELEVEFLFDPLS